MTCLEENELIDLSAGRLGAEALAAAEEHLDGCADCRFLLAELLEPDRVRAPSWDLPRGERVGRYLILDRVGVGGMGTVYAAYDAELGRKVALKLLHARTIHEADGGAWLLREAQAMARLSHVNILAVHDVGAYGGHVFLSMELVEGKSLRAFLQAQAEISLDEIREVFLQAGAGLLAAHRAGIVHCDFKPDNVLRSVDGRIRVSDFGLARLVAAAHDPRPLDAEASAGPARQLEPGGSLPYMAPEQLRNEPVTAASDQWSYCVALYEAVYGERPFRGHTATEIRQAIERGELRLPAHRPLSGSALPAWLLALLARGLSLRPPDRFPSMDALLDALAQRPAQRTRKLAALLLVALALIGGIATVRFIETRPLRACQAAAIASWPHTPSPAPEWTRARGWPELVRALATVRERWTAEAQRSCTDTWERHSQTAATQDLRLRCARRQASDVEALLDVLSRPPRVAGFSEDAAALVARFVRFADHLPDPERCSTARVLLTARHIASSACVGPPCQRGRALLSAARVRRVLLAHDLAQDLLGQASQLAESTGDAALRAEVRLEQGLLWLQSDGQTERGLKAIKEALWLAQRARDDELAAICWERLLTAMSASARPEHIEETRRLLPHAQAALTRIGGDAELSTRLASLAEKLQRTPNPK